MNSRRGTSLDDYIAQRKKEDPAFADRYEEGYDQFKISLMLKMARKEAKMTQTDVAEILGTKKSAISRLEKQAVDMKVSTLLGYLKAVGKEFTIR